MMKKTILLVLICFMAMFALAACNNDAPDDEGGPGNGGAPHETNGPGTPDDAITPSPDPDFAVELKIEAVTFPTEDGLTITANLYTIHDEAPLMIMFHMDDGSRGEYNNIASVLTDLGVNGLAIDQRLGWERNGVLNGTYADAISQWRYIDVFTSEDAYRNALPDVLIDMRAAVQYARDVVKAEKILLMGSESSASLALVLASEMQEQICGVLAFSPSELEIGGENIRDFAARIKIPVLISAQLYTEERDVFEAMMESIPSGDKLFVVTDEFATDALFLNPSEFAFENPTWKQVIDFLFSFLILED